MASDPIRCSDGNAEAHAREDALLVEAALKVCEVEFSRWFE